MNKSLLSLAVAGVGIGAGIIALRNDRPVYKGRIKDNEKIASQIDWHDKHNLRMCPQSELDKRVLPYKSSVNMRDIGGYSSKDGRHIKWKKIYRGEDLEHLSEEDFEKFSQLGITHVIDLRNIKEAKKHRVPEGAAYSNIPVLEDLRPFCVKPEYPNFVDQFMRDIYEELIVKRGDMFAEVLKILRDEPDAVLYIHCTNGKDRTGIMVAIIELLAGVERDQIISDYSLSNLKVDEAFKIFDHNLVKELGKQSGKLLYGTIGVDPNWIDLVLHYIEKDYKGIDDFLIKVSDLTSDDLETIKRNITEFHS